MGANTPTGPSGSALATHRPRGQLVHGARGTSGRVLVLNATYEPINVCTVRRAVVLLLKDKAELLDQAAWRAVAAHLHPRRHADDPAGVASVASGSCLGLRGAPDAGARLAALTLAAALPVPAVVPVRGGVRRRGLLGRRRRGCGCRACA